ncbi:MAG: adenine deaminase, partial [Clostridia bacterium]|nr:adenine deaminase [Clostridia bacterium]
MDTMAVIEGDPEMNAKLQLFDGKVKDGHAPGLSQEDLAAYVIAGITTDHEGTTYEYIMRERSMGMFCHIREGSAARNLESIVKGIVENNTNTEGFCFCTDDRHIEDIIREGDIDNNVRKAVSMGISPIAAIKMATIQPARCYGLRRTGAVAPGFDADLVVWDSLKEFNAQMVFYNGRRIDDMLRIKPNPCPPQLLDTVHLAQIDPRKLVINPNGAEFPVIRMIPGEILTERVDMVLPGTENGGDFVPNGEVDKIATFERHHYTGKIGVGAAVGFGIRGGAIASSVSHDSHNIIAIGDNDEDILIAVRELERTHGGYTIVENGKVYDTLELPIMGLISDRSYSYVSKKVRRMTTKAHKMGVPKDMEPFVTLSFMALPVIPEIRCLPRGIFSVTDWKFLTNS